MDGSIKCCALSEIAAVLDMLRAIAPITAVRGNVDDSCPSLPTHALATLGGYTVLVLHIVKCSKTKGGVTDEAAALIRNHAPNIVVCGHSHTAELWWDTGVLFVNPGSAGPARFKQKRSIAVLTLPDESGSGERPMVEHITLSNKAPPRPRGSSRPPGKRRKVAAKE